MGRIDENRPFIPVNIAVLTVSDTRTLETDTSGQTLVDRLTGAGHRLADRSIVKDEAPAIEARFRAWITDPQVDDGLLVLAGIGKGHGNGGGPGSNAERDLTIGLMIGAGQHARQGQGLRSGGDRGGPDRRDRKKGCKDPLH